MSGVKGRSGRRKSRRRQIEEGMDTVRDRMPEFFQALADLAVGLHVVIPGKEGEPVRAYQKPPDREALMYLIDREYGKPRISLDQRLRNEVILDPASYIEAVRQARLQAAAYLGDETRLIPSPSQNIQIWETDSCSELAITDVSRQIEPGLDARTEITSPAYLPPGEASDAGADSRGSGTDAGMG